MRDRKTIGAAPEFPSFPAFPRPLYRGAGNPGTRNYSFNSPGGASDTSLSQGRDGTTDPALPFGTSGAAGLGGNTPAAIPRVPGRAVPPSDARGETMSWVRQKLWLLAALPGL